MTLPLSDLESQKVDPFVVVYEPDGFDLFSLGLRVGQVPGVSHFVCHGRTVQPGGDECRPRGAANLSTYWELEDGHRYPTQPKPGVLWELQREGRRYRLAVTQSETSSEDGKPAHLVTAVWETVDSAEGRRPVAAETARARAKTFATNSALGR